VSVAAAYAIPGTSAYGIPAAAVGAYFDYRLQNIAESVTNGVDLSGKYAHTTPWGTIAPFMSLTYLISSTLKAASTTPSISQIDRLGLPVALRGRAGVAVSSGPYFSSVTMNYVRGYNDSLPLSTGLPAARISSWTTADFQAGYVPKSTSGFLHGLRIALNVQNIFDKDPPAVKAGSNPFIGFDPANASALGRFISLQLTKAW
jgi:outer membrane receptor protein involved in Fe transport